jgi:hypothetical protein
MLAFLAAISLVIADVTGRIHGAGGLVEILLLVAVGLLAIKGFASLAKNQHHPR